MLKRLRVAGGSIRLPAHISVAISALLVLIAALRMVSYSRATPFGDLVRNSPLRLLAYKPGSYLDVQFFKIIATPTLVAMQYFLFRALN